MRQDAIYARQSIEKQDSLSISGQIDLCRRTAGVDEIKIYQDSGYSGKNTDRPDFKRLMDDIKADRISTLYVYRLDRFSRSVADFGQLWDTLKAHNVEFVSVSENFDTKSPMGRAMLHIIMVFAQLERETIAERVKDNYYRRASLGRWPGGPAPFGYDNGKIKDASGHDVPGIIPNDNAPLVQRIFELYAQDDVTLGSLAKKLNNEGAIAVNRGTWDNVMLSRILHNPTYVMADNQVRLYLLSQGVNVTSLEDAFDGVHSVLLIGKRSANERKYTNLKDQCASVLNSVGIIPAALWLSCQDKLAHNRQVGNSGKGKHTWLSGLLKCAKCGYSIKIAEEKGHRWMLCSGRYNLAHCDASIHADLSELESIVRAEIVAMLNSCPIEPVTLEKEPYAEQLDEIDRRADRLIDAFAESDMGNVYLKRALARLEKERQAILDKRKRERSRPVLPENLDFDALSFDEKKLLAAQFIEKIEINEDSANVIWKI